jgi:hypothetical protein
MKKILVLTALIFVFDGPWSGDCDDRLLAARCHWRLRRFWSLSIGRSVMKSFFSV